jgi:acetylcholinesterase
MDSQILELYVPPGVFPHSSLLTNSTIQAHSSDLANVFGGGVMADYFIRFVNTLDPNGSSSPRAQVEWPRYDAERPQLLTFLPEHEEHSAVLTDDDFRKEQIEWFAELAQRYRM